jgi:integrase
VNGFWFLVRRVPAEFAAYDTRKLVRQSTGIRIVDDPRGIRAGEVVAKLHSELIRYWKDKRRGRDRDGEARYEQACNRARSLGLNYVPAADAAVNLTLDDILRRFEILTRRGTADSAVAFAPTFVQERILADGMFDDLNPEARRVIYLIAETGLRLSEAINLSRETICLNAAVPHVCVALFRDGRYTARRRHHGEAQCRQPGRVHVLLVRLCPKRCLGNQLTLKAVSCAGL